MSNNTGKDDGNGGRTDEEQETGSADDSSRGDQWVDDLVAIDSADDVSDVIDVDDLAALEDALTALNNQYVYGDDDAAGWNEEVAESAVHVAAFVPADAHGELEELVDDSCQFAAMAGVYDDAQGMRNELSDERTTLGNGKLLEVVDIVKEVPVDSEVGDRKYHFYVVTRGSQHPEKITMPMDALNTSRAFETEVLGITDTPVDFSDDWNDRLMRWLSDHKPIEVITEDPLSNEHDLVEDVVAHMKTLEIVGEFDYFKAHPKKSIYYDRGEHRVLVSSKLIRNVKNKNGYSDVKMRKVRSILENLVVSGTKSKTVRTLDENFMNVWQFDPDMLATALDLPHGIPEEAELWEEEGY